MTTDVEKNAARTMGPYKGTTGNTGVDKFAVSATHAVLTVRPEWQGRFVKLQAIGASVDYYFTQDSGASVVYDLAAGAASATRGRRLVDGNDRDEICPRVDRQGPSDTMYLIVEASGAGAIEISLAE